MNDEDLELLLCRILSGKLYFTYNLDSYELRSPDNELKYKAQLLYNSIINEEKYNYWIREADLNSLLITLGLWTQDTMTIMKDIEKKIDNHKVDLFKFSTLLEKTKSIRKNLGQYKNQLYHIQSKKSDLFANTLEGYALSIKNEYIICNTLFRNSHKVFRDNALNDQDSYGFFNNLVNEINKNNISITAFKSLCRHQLWKSFWNCNKGNIFNAAISDLTEEQRTIINIARMYDSVYDHPECPSDVVIEDDDMLEGWMILQRRKSDQAKNQQRVDELNSKLKNAQEVFIMADSQESFEEIANLNSSESKYRMQEKFAYVNANGSASDAQLPDVQRQLQQQSNQLRKQK
jgi:hypothetical protein